MKTIKLNTGAEIPMIGLGTWKATGKQVKQAVATALKIGYRHIDTAKVYGNEEEVGAAIAESGIKREDIFVTTKLWNSDQGFDKAKVALKKSLAALKLDYVDLYLIHWPLTKTRFDSWRALEEVCGIGLTKAIGVSNFTIKHLTELLEHAKVKPAVNQVEFHPFLYQRELLEFCRANNIVLEAYSPLVHGKRLNHEVIVKIASEHNKSCAQIILAWNLAKGNVILPKSVTPERIEENFSLFDIVLTPEEIAVLDSLNENYRTCWDPTDLP